ncbi:CBO0543 family protein [Rossellomorea sp. BNER]|uniref:CBO0543 family protein n=1 Tax=Rossellomorea sp. BNER TaxID=2962031 RepID=UPI003AF1F3E8|nr:hypothetical protein [Rossellomorea sp. BNER]
MEIILLWLLLIGGIGLFILSLRKPPQKDWLLIFFMTGFFAVFLGVIVVEEHLIRYPVNLFKHFQSSVLFEFLLFPVLCIYYYQATYHSGFWGIILKALVYSSVLSILEFFLEKYTDLIDYLHWEWYFTLVSVFLFMIIVRSIMGLTNYLVKNDDTR